MPNRKISREDYQVIAERYQNSAEKKSFVRKVANEYQVTVAAIYRILVAKGVWKNKTPAKPVMVVDGKREMVAPMRSVVQMSAQDVELVEIVKAATEVVKKIIPTVRDPAEYMLMGSGRPMPRSIKIPPIIVDGKEIHF